MFLRLIPVAALLGAVLYWFFIRLEPEDVASFQKLTAESAGLRARSVLGESPAWQERRGVEKTLWTKEEMQRFSIRSESSSLSIQQRGDRLEAIERLKTVHCTAPNEFTLDADEGIYNYPFDPKEVVLEGNVRLISSEIEGKKSYAIADRLTYHPLEQTLLFSADRKVLFWQEGLSLSASEVLIHADRTIEGRGDVHCAFDGEEQAQIEAFFKRYL